MEARRAMLALRALEVLHGVLPMSLARTAADAHGIGPRTAADGALTSRAIVGGALTAEVRVMVP
eukprot:166258-Prymnesium_polylepis.1